MGEYQYYEFLAVDRPLKADVDRAGFVALATPSPDQPASTGSR